MSKDLICKQCKTPFVKKAADLDFGNTDTGKYTVKTVIHYKCESCGDIIIKPPESTRVELEGIIARTIHYIKTNGPQPKKALKHHIAADEILFNKAIEYLSDNDILNLEPNSKMPIIGLTVVKKQQKSFFRKLKDLFKK